MERSFLGAERQGRKQLEENEGNGEGCGVNSRAENKGPGSDKGAVAGTQSSDFQGSLCMFTLPSPFGCAAGNEQEDITS